MDDDFRGRQSCSVMCRISTSLPQVQFKETFSNKILEILQKFEILMEGMF